MTLIHVEPVTRLTTVVPEGAWPSATQAGVFELSR